MEHVDTGAMDNWYANRGLPFPNSLQRLAVIAPDTAPGLAALRQRLAQRSFHPLRCDHYAAGFNETGSERLRDAFEQLRGRHAAEPYDVVLLIDGSPDALGIAESNGLIPEQVSRTPAPVWTAIGEDDANTELGDVANRVFASAAALIEALPLCAPAQPAPQLAFPSTSTPEPAAGQARTEPARRPRAAALSLVSETAGPDAINLPALATPAERPAPARTHPLVLCAAGAVIVASFTAMAAMLGLLPGQKLFAAAPPASPAPVSTAVTARPAAAPAVLPASAELPAPAAATVPASEPPAGPPLSPEAPAVPAAPQSRDNESGGVPLGTVAALGAAGLAAASPRKPYAAAAGSKPKRPAQRAARPAPARPAGPRQVGSNEVPAVEFVGTRTRQEVVAEMMAARRAANRQAAYGNYLSGQAGRPSAN